jgi:hypothetical protein
MQLRRRALLLASLLLASLLLGAPTIELRLLACDLIQHDLEPIGEHRVFVAGEAGEYTGITN